MLGFFVGPASGDLPVRLPELIGRCRTIHYVDRLDAGADAAWIYQTEGPNNYRLQLQDGSTLIAAGTVMLGRARGPHALELIGNRLLAGEALATIFSDLRGPFSLLHVDPRAPSIVHLTDRDGLMRSYQTSVDGRICTSTSQLLLAALGDHRVDRLGVQEFIHGGNAVEGRTLFDGISIIPAATLSQLSAPGAPRQVLWRPTARSPNLPDSDTQIVDTMHRMFETALDTERLDPNKSFGTDLTAGTDSRTVLSFLLRSGQPLIASTAGPADGVDVERARVLARKAGIEHYWYPVEPTVEFDQTALGDAVEYSDGVTSPFGLLKQVAYFREKTRRFDILFGGNGGPLFKDHYWLFEWNRVNIPGDPNWARIARYSLTEGKVNGKLFKGGIDYLPHMERLFRENTAGVQGTNNQKLDFMYFDFKCQWFAAAQFTFANRFLDTYHPMCDGRLVEYSMSVRPWIRQRARMQSELIHRNHPGIAWVLTDNYVPCVPDVGWRYPLRLTRAIRYLRAVRRKFEDFVLDRRNQSRDSRASTFVQSLGTTKLGVRFQQPASLRLAPMLDLDEAARLFASVSAGMHSGYVQRIFAIEAILDRVEELRGRPVELQRG